MAIKACREERGKVLHNHENMQVVKEALNEGYCDVSGRAGDLKLLGKSQFVVAIRLIFNPNQARWEVLRFLLAKVRCKKASH